MDSIYTMNLQLFADGGGELVNTTGNYTNAYTGTNTSFTASQTLAPELKTFYDTEMLENARVRAIYGQFGKKVPLPAGNGKNVEFRKWNTFARASQLQEGVIPTGQKFGVSVKTGSINQYGTYTAISDQLELHSYDDIILGATEEMGASAGETQEFLIRDALLTNTNVMYCDNIDKGTGTVLSTPTSCATMGAGGGTNGADGWSLLTPDMVAKAVTCMKKNKVPTINGKYVAVIHPSVAYDLRKSDEWVEAHKYAATRELFNGEIGELHGMIFIENTDAPILGGSSYKNKSNTVTYATYVFGKDAFGHIDPAGGGMEMIIKDKSQAGGPLNQFSTIGYKFEDGVAVLYPERLLRIMSCSSYSATDTVN